MSEADRRKPAEMPEHRLPHSAISVPTARRLAEQAVAPRIPPDQVDDFVLMVSEAVSNAILHAPPLADGRIAVRFEVDDGLARGEVTDGGSSFVPDPHRSGEDGRSLHLGLALIDTLSNRWGVTVDGVTNVWFEVDAA